MSNNGSTCHPLSAPTHEGMPGWVDVGRWLHTEINDRHQELNQDTVTHPSTNRARRRLTSLIETNALPLRYTASSKIIKQELSQPLRHSVDRHDSANVG